ncbi:MULTISPECIES: ABC transporter permease [unclassified Salinibacterium]|uniref:ABC transporter permease n=1 Tax=unclassified Salinibacterium TaxID=2632331 RepID=UPI001F0FB6B8|nr:MULTISPECIES: ABC transporter permease [unclassified Salinibacterium]
MALLSDMERVSEMGLRRAVWATQRQVGRQLMVESVVIGLIGGLIGAAVGWASGWYPAWRAGRIEPVAALRGS